MKIDIKDIEKNQKELQISITPQEMEKYLDSAAKNLSKDMKIKGFREGKEIPRNIVESSVGKEGLWKEALPEAIEESYWEAIEKNNIEAIGRPQITVKKLVPGNDLEFSAVIPVMPSFKLPDYKKIAKEVIAKEKTDVKVEEKEVEDALKWLQKSRAPQQAEDKDAKDASQKAKVGVDIPENLPKLDDAFAKSVGGFKDMEALKKSIKNGLKQEKEGREKEKVRLKILEKIAEKSNLQVPDSLIETELTKMQQEFEQQISQMGMQIDDYLQKANKKMEDLRKDWQAKAKERVVSAILLRSIAEAEDIKVPKKEVEEEANKYLAQFGGAEEAKKQIDPKQLNAYISGIIKNEKVFELLEKAQKPNNNNDNNNDM